MGLIKVRCPKCGAKMIELRGRKFVMKSEEKLIVVREYMCRNKCVLEP